MVKRKIKQIIKQMWGMSHWFVDYDCFNMSPRDDAIKARASKDGELVIFFMDDRLVIERRYTLNYKYVIECITTLYYSDPDLFVKLEKFSVPPFIKASA